MLWRMMFWAAVVEVAFCVLPFEVTGVTAVIQTLSKVSVLEKAP
jgi:hypothetical protein